MNIPLLAGAAFALFGIYMLMNSLRNFRKALRSVDWPTSDGTLNKVMLWGRRNVDGEMKEVERLSVEYEYEVEGKSYNGTTVALYTLVYPETFHYAEEHPTGSTTRVYYDPEDPASAVLIPGTRADHKRYSDLILAALSILIGLSIAAAGWLGYLG